MTNTMGTGKRGDLVFGSCEQGSATYWEIRREGKPCGTGPGKRLWLVYRTSVAVTLVGEYGTPKEAYAEIDKHVGPRGFDLEASLSR